MKSETASLIEASSLLATESFMSLSLISMATRAWPREGGIKDSNERELNAVDDVSGWDEDDGRKKKRKKRESW